MNTYSITDIVIEVTGEVVVSRDPDYCYLYTDQGDFVIGRRPSNSEVFHGAILAGKARLWKGCAWDGELIEWETAENDN